MAAKRISDIQSNLSFAKDSWRDVQALIVEAQRVDGQVKHIAQKTGTILQATRECFDYCAKDIVEDFIPGFTGNAYFPFHPDSLSRGKALYPLQQTHSEIYMSLHAITERVRERQLIPNTLSLYSDAKALNELVNSKKHDVVIEVIEQRNSLSMIEFGRGASVIATPWQRIGPEGVPIPAQTSESELLQWDTRGATVKAVKNFMLPNEYGASRNDVIGFCMVAMLSARRILGDVYSFSYGKSADIFMGGW